MSRAQSVRIIGGGLAGCEAALQLAHRGVAVELWEMRPRVPTPAHTGGGLAELVCSNSFKGTGLSSAHGLFKRELLILGSRLLRIAGAAAVPAGASLAVDRRLFSSLVEQAIQSHPLIRVIREEARDLDPKRLTLVASGPLTSDALCAPLFALVGQRRLRFFDSIAPVVELDSLDLKFAYWKNRWDKGATRDFLNCPLDRRQYLDLVEALREADSVEPKDFEPGELFEGCLPIEEMARRGTQTLRYGPLRPIGLWPDDGPRPHAVLQLRAENRHKTLFNLVGCQTRLRWGTQREIFSRIPALRGAHWARMGSMHRNTFIDSPGVLDARLRVPGSSIFFAGQITGAEGYTEAVGTGLFAAAQIHAELEGSECAFPEETCLGALTRHLTHPNPDFQPMNMNFGLFPQPVGVPRSRKKELAARKCLAAARHLRRTWSGEGSAPPDSPAANGPEAASPAPIAPQAGGA